MEPEERPERAPKDEYMHLYDLGHEGDPEADEVENEFDDPDPNYCNDVENKNKESEDIDWFEDRYSLNISEQQMLEVGTWIHKMQKLHPCIKIDQGDSDTLTKEQLNFKQRIAYDLIEEWVNEKTTAEGRDVKPFYLNLSGRAGCGKSAVLNAFQNISKAKPSNPS